MLTRTDLSLLRQRLQTLRARVAQRFGLSIPVFVLLLGLGYGLLSGLLVETLPRRLIASPTPHVHGPTLLLLLLADSVLAPVIEETIFRGAPILALRTLGWERARWPVALMVSLLFALAHTRWHQVPLHFPLTQFGFGLLAWAVTWTYGLRHSMLLHATVNTTLILLIPLALLAAGVR